MKEFDLVAAKKGAPVCTRDGHKARIVCFDVMNNPFPIIAVIDHGGYESFKCFTLNGMMCIDESVHSCFDLMMADIPKIRHVGWINVCYNAEGRDVTRHYIYPNKNAAENSCPDDFHTVKIEWEDEV